MAEFSISGAECVEALCTVGFRVRRRTAGRTVLARGERLVVIPDALVLPGRLLDDILEQAGVSPESFRTLVGDIPVDSSIVCEPMWE